MPSFNINSDACVVFAVRLERLSKTAIPNAIRQTLNRTAMDVKQNTMIEQSNRAFIKRKPTFFNATSKVEFAKGSDINTLAAVVGFVAPGTKKESGHATQDLEEQEHGGSINKRAFIATTAGRTSAGNVQDSLTLARIKSHIVDAKREMGKNDGERFIRAAMKVGYTAGGGTGIGGYVIGTGRNAKGNRALMKIISIHRRKTGEAGAGNMVVKTKEIYSVHGGRKAHVKATRFMEKASAESAKKMEQIFAEEAEKRFNRIM